MVAKKSAAKKPPVEDVPSEEPAPLDLASILKRKSTDPIVENGREFGYGKIPYYVKGKRVTREEYVANQRGIQKQALKDELTAAVAEDTAAAAEAAVAEATVVEDTAAVAKDVAALEAHTIT